MSNHPVSPRPVTRRLTPLRLWRRLPIGVKLLLPIALTFLVLVLLVVLLVSPALSTFTQQDLQAGFDAESNRIIDQVKTFFVGAEQALREIRDSNEMQRLAESLVQGDTLQLDALRGGVSSVMLSSLELATTAYADLRLLTLDGDQLVVVTAAPFNAPVKASSQLFETLSTERDQPYIATLQALVKDNYYLTEFSLQPLALFPSSFQRELAFQFGTPVFHDGRRVALLVGSLRPQRFLAEALQPGASSAFNFTNVLLDADLNPLGVSRRGESVFVGDRTWQPPTLPRGLPLSPLPTVREIDGRNYQLFDLAATFNGLGIRTNGWRLLLTKDASESPAVEVANFVLNVIGRALLVFFCLLIGLAFVMELTVRPLRRLTAAARRIAEGDLTARVEVSSEDEIGQLGAVFNDISGRLSSLITTLEARVAERTRNIEIAAQIGREATLTRDIDVLLQGTVNAIRDRFNFYHAQVFLLDDMGEYAVLRTSTGEAGRELLRRRHKLAVGSASIVGQVTQKKRTFITLDTQQSEVPHRFNPILPHTRSEMALPLQVGGKLIGCLDIQSVEPNAFDQDDVQIFQLLADQLAIAIDNARLLAEQEQRVREIDELNKRLTREGWQEYTKKAAPGALSYQYDLSQTSQPGGNGTGNLTLPAIAAPIQVRGEIVGELSVAENPDLPLTAEDKSLVQAVAERVSLAIENTRLIEQTQEALQRVEQLYHASSALGSVETLDMVYRIAAEQLATNGAVDRVVFILARPLPILDAPTFELAYSWSRQNGQPYDHYSGQRIPREAIPERWRAALNHSFTDDLRRADIGGREFVVRFLEPAEMVAIAYAPLNTSTRWFGGVFVESRRPAAFSDQFVQFMEAITDQIGIAIENRYLFAETQNEARSNRILAEAAQIASQIGVDFETGVAELIGTVAPAANFDRWWFGQLVLTTKGVVAERVASEFPPASPLQELERIRLEGDNNTIAEAMRSGQLVIVNDPSENTAIRRMDLERAEAFGKHLVAPVRIAGNTVGVLLLGRSLTQPDIDERDRQLSMTLVSQIAVAMENRRLYEETQTERETLETILDSLPTGVMVADASSKQVTLTNRQARTLLGLDAIHPYTLINGSTDTPYTPDQLPLQRVLNTGQPVVAEDMIVRDDYGNRSNLIVNAVPITREGKLISAVAVYQDVTDLRDLESVLQESLRETTTLYEMSRSISAENTALGILGVVARQLVSQYRFDHFLILTEQPDGQYLIYTLEEDTERPDLIPTRQALPVPKRLLAREESFVDSNIRENPDLADSAELQALGVVSVGLFPLKVRNRVLGWFFIGYNAERAFTAEERRVIGNIADQTAVAIQSIRLSEQTALALETTTRLFTASSQVNRASNLSDMLASLRDQLIPFGATQIDIYVLANRETSQGVQWAVSWRDDDPANLDILLSNGPILEDIAFMESPAYFVPDVRQADPQTTFLMQLAPNWGSFAAQAAVPMVAKGRPNGRIVLSYDTPVTFRESDAQIITTLADQAAISIDNFILVEQTQESLNETAILYQTSRAIANAGGLQEELQAIVDYAMQPNVSTAMIIRLNGASWTATDASLEVSACWQRDADSPDLSGIRFTPNQFPVWADLAKRELIWYEDLLANVDLDDAPAVYQMFGFRAMVILPLSSPGRPLGALVFGSDETWKRSEREIRIYSSLADLVGISIERQRLIEQTERRARQLELSAQVAQAVTSTLDLADLFDRTVGLIKENFGFDHVQIFRITPDGKDARVVSSTGEAGKRLLAIRHSLPVGSRSVIGQVTATGAPYIVSDITDPRSIHRPNPYLPKTRAEMALPLRARGRILGALDVQSNEPGAFTREDENILSALADQIATAIDNAELFNDSVRRGEEMRFLFDTTRLATDAFSDDRTTPEELTAIAEAICHQMSSEAAALFLLDDTGSRLVPYGASKPGISINLQPYYEYNTPFIKAFAESHEPMVVNDTSVMQDIIKTSQRLGQFRLLQQFKGLLPDAGSTLLLPLYSGDNFVGMIGVAKVQTFGFNDDALRLMQTLGASLANIIQNARLLREVRKANLRLMELDRVKSQFLANMSHELRTPLNSIIGFSRVILKGIDGPLTDTQEQDLTTIHEAGKHLLGLVNDILDQAKIEADRMEFASMPFSMAEVVRGVCSTGTGLIKDKPIRLYQEIEPDLPMALGDEFRTRQALLNLVSNAAKFTQQGSITVSAFRLEENGRPFIQVSVTDTGIGIPADKLQVIFEPFQQAENSAARQYEGTGLGLPIARKLIEKQGGRMWVQSELGVGSTFSLTIPVAPETPEAAGTGQASEQR